MMRLEFIPRNLHRCFPIPVELVQGDGDVLHAQETTAHTHLGLDGESLICPHAKGTQENDLAHSRG